MSLVQKLIEKTEKLHSKSTSSMFALKKASPDAEQRESKGEFLLNREGLTFYNHCDILGEGSYSKVKKAYSKRLERDVAVKIISSEKSTTEVKTKFLPRELEVIRSLRHDAIIKHYAVFDLNTKVFIVMDLAKNGDLLDYIKKNDFVAEHLAKNIFAKIMSGVAHLHSKGIVHRDLKCENILLDENMKPKISDFGFSRYVSQNAAGMDELCSTYCGSLAYAPIELVKGIPYDGYKSDIWSSGVILFVMVTGVMPFDDRNTKKLILQLKRGAHFHGIKQAITAKCKSVIQKILDPCPMTRPTATEVLKDHWFEQGMMTMPKPISLPAISESPTVSMN